MNLSDTDKDFRTRLDCATPHARLRVILQLALPTFVPQDPQRRPTREELRAHSENCIAVSLPIKDQLEALGLTSVSMLTNLGLAIVVGTPGQIKQAVALNAVTAAVDGSAETVLIQGLQDDGGHAARVAEERKDKGPPQVGG
jgi:hypothetical protein